MADKDFKQLACLLQLVWENTSFFLSLLRYLCNIQTVSEENVSYSSYNLYRSLNVHNLSHLYDIVT